MTLSASVLEDASDPRTTPVEQRCPPPQQRQSSFLPGGKGDAEAPPAALRSGSAGGEGASSRFYLYGSRPPLRLRLLTLHLRSTVLFLHFVLCSRLPHPLRPSSGVPHRTGGRCADVGAYHCLPRGTGKRQGTSSPHSAGIRHRLGDGLLPTR